MEIQRLIGRSLRAAVNAELLGERTVWIDCDVIQADGGTRTASITGSYVALIIALGRLYVDGKLTSWPINDFIAAVSVGVIGGVPMLDLNYEEDSSAEADANFVLTGVGDIVEIQATGEKRGFTRAEFESLFALAEKGIGELFVKQREAVSR